MRRTNEENLGGEDFFLSFLSIFPKNSKKKKNMKSKPSIWVEGRQVKKANFSSFFEQRKLNRCFEDKSLGHNWK